MTTTTPRLFKRRRACAAFSLIEVMVAASLGALIMGAVLSTFLFIGRSTVNMRNYTDMETQSRNAMETFAQDVRMASDVNWLSSTSLALTAKDSGADVVYTYTYSSGAKTLTRQRTAPTTGAADVLVTDVKSLTFTAYQIDTVSVSLAGLPSVVANKATKQVQLSIETERTNPTLAISTNKVISARFILRNKLRTT